MEYRIRIQAARVTAIVALGVAVSLITSTIVAARAYREQAVDTARQQEEIRVKGSTRQRIRSDRAVWTIHVRGDGVNLPEAFTVLEAGVLGVQAFLDRMGFAEAEVDIGAIDTVTHYKRNAKGNRTNTIESYTLNRAFCVTTDNVRRVAESAGKVTELIREGVHVISSHPEYVYTKLGPLKIELMAAASADARARAEKIAANTGCALGALRYASMGVLQITAPESTEVSSYGLYDTHTIDKDVRAVVTTTFGIHRE